MAAKFYKLTCPLCDTPLLANTLDFACPHCQGKPTFPGQPEEYPRVEILNRDDTPIVLIDEAARAQRKKEKAKHLLQAGHAKNNPRPHETTLAKFFYFLAAIVLILGICISAQDENIFFATAIPTAISTAILIAIGKFLTYASDISISQRDQAESLRELSGRSKTNEDK